MQPNEQPLPPNYLDQIAPKNQNKLAFFKQKPIIIGGIIVILLLLILAISGASSMFSSGKVKTEHLAARLESTQKVSESAANNIKNSDLRAVNSQLDLDLTNMIRDLTDILAKQNIKVDKISKTITNTESNTDMLNKLEDARLNAVYDRTYSREMGYQIQTILDLMNEIYKGSNKSTQNFINSSEKDLKTIQGKLEEFNE